ncbi:YqzE family protein [Aureibacillus halotolerans]|uniref:YqzE-like protein n=1 Tax=Aureibacillus halotolerans TaxID=1508390 RepID=A0A4R6U614_9BACI|nr:YqzE family protein [Aureibacillus halotolerans]TDQ41671.1 YqzE-like protein [Aureibacillus halotolerans]
MSVNDFVKFLTAQLVTGFEMNRQNPKPEKQLRVVHPCSHRWFGVLPFSLSMMFGRR